MKSKLKQSSLPPYTTAAAQDDSNDLSHGMTLNIALIKDTVVTLSSFYINHTLILCYKNTQVTTNRTYFIVVKSALEYTQFHFLSQQTDQVNLPVKDVS